MGLFERIKAKLTKEKEIKRLAKIRQDKVVADLTCSACGCNEFTDIELDQRSNFVLDSNYQFIIGKLCNNCGHIDLFRKID